MMLRLELFGGRHHRGQGPQDECVSLALDLGLLSGPPTQDLLVLVVTHASLTRTISFPACPRPTAQNGCSNCAHSSMKRDDRLLDENVSSILVSGTHKARRTADARHMPSSTTIGRE
jgi:hypothetical protein